MNAMPHVRFRMIFARSAIICVLLRLSSCVDLDLTGGSRARQGEAKARAPYYGTGLVARVIRPDLVELTFESSPLPATMATLIIVRSNRVVAKVKFNGGRMGNRYLCVVLDGTPKEGDLVLGWQREAGFTPPQPRKKQPWEKLP